MRKRHEFEGSPEAADVRAESLLATIREVAQAWSERIDHMEPLVAQRFIASNTAKLLTSLSDGCGAELANLIVDDIERVVWSNYDRNHKVSIAA